VQQLSLLAPQLVSPVPPGAQLVMGRQAPPTHCWAVVHVVVTHWPQVLHVWAVIPDVHCRAPGVHTGGVAGHEQTPHAQPAVQVCVPLVLQVWVALGAQTP
jgi:hypothetical protein